MELKVWVEGIQRIVCGVTVNTTCQDVVFALAHATGKVGRFTLIERWRNNERHLAPNENPLKLLLKWGEYANDVQFILQRSENKQQPQQQPQPKPAQARNEEVNNNNNNNTSADNCPTYAVAMKKPLGLANGNINSGNPGGIAGATNLLQKQKSNVELSYKSKELKKSFGAYDAKQIENIGIVKGIPQQQQQSQLNNNNKLKIKATNNYNGSAHSSPVPESSSFVPRRHHHEKSHSNPIEMPSTQQQQQQQRQPQEQQQQSAASAAYHDYYNYGNNNNNNHIYSQLNNTQQQQQQQNSKLNNEINLAEVRNALDRRNTTTITTTATATTNTNNVATTANELFYNNNNTNNNHINQENLMDIYANTNTINGTSTPYSNSNNQGAASPNDLYKQTSPPPPPHTISANGALVPPPYRDPPPPRTSPMQIRIANAETVSNGSSSTATTTTTHGSVAVSSTSTGTAGTQPANTAFVSDYNSNEYDCYDQFGMSETSQSTGTCHTGVHNNNNNSNPMDTNDSSLFQTTQYNDLLQLIKFQREKISTQQMELSKFDAEIVFLEHKERDQAQELEAISREITKADQIFRQGSEQLQTLQYVEEENELVKQQEKTLKSEITLLRSKLSNCESELLQCKQKIRLLMDDIELEQRVNMQKQKSNRQNFERDFLLEMERIQSEIDHALHNTDTSNKTADNLKKELLLIENAIAEKKRQVEQLVNEMKEVNLQSLTVTTSEEIKHLLEGHNKQGSSRRIIGSPRQLENAVPTSKNPHGVWV